MQHYSLPLQVRWSDIDANRHLRHSVYYDYGSYCRMELLTEIGLNTHKLAELGIGPILFREEAIFRREVVFEDRIKITADLIKGTSDYSRWSIQHQILKEDGTVAAIVTVDGAWIDLEKRKLAIPNDFVKGIFDQIPKSMKYEEFVLERKS
jgi:acyl-CoA thioester hydrolase